jgi:hypothetical protein
MFVAVCSFKQFLALLKYFSVILLKHLSFLQKLMLLKYLVQDQHFHFVPLLYRFFFLCVFVIMSSSLILLNT